MSDSATTITPELIAELRERYTPPTIPPCRVCGGELSIARVGGGEPTEWVCSGKEDDPDRPGWLRDAPGRWTNAPDGGSSELRADGHYSRSRWTDYRSGGDSGVIAVLDALESKVQQPAAVDESSPRVFCMVGEEISSGTLDDLIDEVVESDMARPGDTIRVEEWVCVRQFDVGPEDDARLAAQQGGGTDE